jgi:hypothetical protein
MCMRLPLICAIPIFHLDTDGDNVRGTLAGDEDR